MKLQIKKWTLRLSITALLIVSILIVIILNPILTYANKTEYNNFTIYYNQQINQSFLKQTEQANKLLEQSEFYNKNLKLDICLNDGSKYSKIVETVGGKAFARGFYDKIVLFGEADFNNNFIELNGYKWNLTQLMAHEMTHCLQVYKLGLWKSKPFATIPNWKWEGYAEYIARQNTDQKDLSKNIERLLKTDSEDWGIIFEDSTIAPRNYYSDWVLIQYCIDVKKMTYKEILTYKIEEETIRAEMLKWYKQQK